jgi:recombination protein RecA
VTHIDDIISQVNKAFGDNALRRGSDPTLQVQRLPTGVLPLDYILGGGLPRGRFVEVFGDSSALKSFVGLQAIGKVQSLGGRCALVDTEHAWDDEWAAHLGVDVDDLLVMHPETGERAVAVTELLIRDKYDLVVWDSVAATLPKAYQEAQPGDSADNAPARLAAMMSRACARLNAANSQTILLCINQTRVNVGMTYGGPRESTPGGKALGYYASLRLRFQKAGKLTQDRRVWDGEKWATSKDITGLKIRMTLEKSKLSAPNKETWFVFDLATGSVDSLGFLMAQAMETNLIQSSGAWMTVPELDVRVQGQKKLKSMFENDPEAYQWLLQKVMPESSVPPPGASKLARRKAARPKGRS